MFLSGMKTALPTLITRTSPVPGLASGAMLRYSDRSSPFLAAIKVGTNGLLE